MKDNLMLLDTHVHTSQVSPCGKVPAEEMIELYKEAGYGGVIITDHYYKGTLNPWGIDPGRKRSNPFFPAIKPPWRR